MQLESSKRMEAEEEKKAIEKNPEILYNQLTPTLIKEKLIPYLDYHLKS